MYGFLSLTVTTNASMSQSHEGSMKNSVFNSRKWSSKCRTIPFSCKNFEAGIEMNIMKAIAESCSYLKGCSHFCNDYGDVFIIYFLLQTIINKCKSTKITQQKYHMLALCLHLTRTKLEYLIYNVQGHSNEYGWNASKIQHLIRCFQYHPRI